MIASMEKYTFLLFRDDQQKFLDTLGRVGVMDITIGDYNPNRSEERRVGKEC